MLDDGLMFSCKETFKRRGHDDEQCQLLAESTNSMSVAESDGFAAAACSAAPAIMTDARAADDADNKSDAFIVDCACVLLPDMKQLSPPN